MDQVINNERNKYVYNQLGNYKQIMNFHRIEAVFQMDQLVRWRYRPATFYVFASRFVYMRLAKTSKSEDKYFARSHNATIQKLKLVSLR